MRAPSVPTSALMRGMAVAAGIALTVALGVAGVPAAQAAGLVIGATGATAASGTASGSAAVNASGGATDTSGFHPGFIISDDSFYNTGAMTEAQVQHFLAAQPCQPQGDVPCLADYRQTTTTQPTRFAHCAYYRGVDHERASAIIWRVAQACGINPRVLLVLVQKEQSLVTRPSASGYQRATGYGCPDSSGCESRYFGFFNQLYHAAWQFRHYGAVGGWRYHIGTVKVLYHPSPSCGSALVHIRNQATANLYNYTPYQPDTQTLAHPDGPPGKCSTYGNLNFWRIWMHWFGNPTSVRFPPWLPACLNLVGGRSCPPVAIPPTAAG